MPGGPCSSSRPVSSCPWATTWARFSPRSATRRSSTRPAGAVSPAMPGVGPPSAGSSQSKCWSTRPRGTGGPASRTVGNLTIDPDLGWLIGFTLGDGSFGYVPALRQYRVRWFSGTTDVLERVRAILARQGIHVSIQQDARGLLSVATLTQRFVHDLLEACGLEKFGPKDDLIRVPEIIA